MPTQAVNDRYATNYDMMDLPPLHASADKMVRISREVSVDALAGMPALGVASVN